MVDWEDPVTLLLSARALILFVHALFGLYLWEFFTSLDFDWEFISGARKWRWTYIVYFITRYSTLFGFITEIIGLNAFSPLDCELLNFWVFALAHSAFGFSSLLLLLRVVALSDKNIYVIVVFGALYLANWGTLIEGIVVARSEYIPALYVCGATNTAIHKLNVLVSFGIDFLLLLTTLAILIQNNGGARGSLWKLLIKQGVIYFVVATIAYLIPSVFLLLNLNDAINMMSMATALTMMAICATRMYRGLTHYADNPTSITGNTGIRFTSPSKATTSALSGVMIAEESMVYPMAKVGSAYSHHSSLDV